MDRIFRIEEEDHGQDARATSENPDAGGGGKKSSTMTSTAASAFAKRYGAAVGRGKDTKDVRDEKDREINGEDGRG